MLQDYKDFAEYIVKNYSNARKIVEVGVGREFSVLRELKKKLRNARVIATDVAGRGVIIDDITRPDVSIYENAELIYSIRPPPELYPYLESIARRVGADLIIRSLSSDFVKTRGKIINYKKASFYLYKF
ncbi:MAG: hypothetical protein HY930_01830 [Euryarchaeota archaeon]|nr:hypothetical protein [Euryarchaeota archaeon]